MMLLWSKPYVPDSEPTQYVKDVLIFLRRIVLQHYYLSHISCKLPHLVTMLIHVEANFFVINTEFPDKSFEHCNVLFSPV